MTTNIAWAINHYKCHNESYELYENYYEGNHISVFAQHQSRKIIGMLADIFARYADNLCPAVVNTFADRLQVGQFATSNPTVQDIIDKTWKSSKLDIKSSAIHRSAIKLGDAYVIVWPDKTGKPRVYLQDSENIAIQRDEDGDIIQAVKAWCENGLVRVNVYSPISIERYVAKNDKININPELKGFVPYDLDGSPSVAVNPYGQVPVFHFSNSCGDDFAQSELRPAIPIQNSLNWSVVYMYIAAVNAALPLRAIFGVETPKDADGNDIPINMSPGTLLTVGSGDGKIAQLDGANLEQFLKISDNTRQEIARVTQTPNHLMMMDSANYPSGKALRTAEAPLMAKVRDRQISFGDTWEQVMAFACKLSNVEPGEITCQWVNTASDNDLEDTQVMLNKQTLGLPKDQILSEMGYSTEQINNWDTSNGNN